MLIFKGSKWDRYFLKEAEFHARELSKDPSTKVGAVIVKDGKNCLLWGFNGFPEGIDDNERLNDREVKNEIIIHAEVNCILKAARYGIPILGTTMYIAACNVDGDVWGGPPCHKCMPLIIQSGIAEIVTWPFKDLPSRWKSSLDKSMKLIKESGIKYREITP